MSSEAKRIKILTLIELVLGFVLIGFAIFLFVGGTDAAVAALVGAQGVVTLVFGGRGALIANVPARIGKLATLALITLAIQIVLCAAIVYLIGPDRIDQNPLPVVCSAVPSLLAIVIFLFARGMAKRAER